MKKKVVISFMILFSMVISFVSCSLLGGLTSKSFNITVNSIEGNSKKHSVVLEFSKTKDDLKYFLYQDGEEIANGNVGTSGGTKEYILDNGTSTSIDYKIKVISGDEELLKEVTYEVGSKDQSSNSSNNEENKSESNLDDEDDKDNAESTEKDSNKEENTNTSQTGISEWSAESKEYKTGDKVTQEGVTYECINDHTSQAAWAPKQASSLWSKVE